MKGSANAGLTVKWLLIQGTADFAVPISQIMRIVDTLGRADKPFDLMILPEFGHGGNTRVIRYWQDRASEYLVEHLRTFIPSWHGSRKAQAFAQLGFVTFVTRKSYDDPTPREPWKRFFPSSATADSVAVIRQLARRMHE